MLAGPNLEINPDRCLPARVRWKLRIPIGPNGAAMANPIKRLRRNIGRYYTWGLVIYGEVEMKSFEHNN